MPTATFARSLEVRAAPEAAWTALLDIDRLVAWVSILEQAAVQEPLARYSATLADRLGPFKLRADLAIAVSDAEPPRFVRVKAAGEDRQVSSRISVEATVALEPAGTGTRLEVAGHYEVTGRVATLGAGTIHKKAERVLEEFFTNAARELDGA